MLPCSKNKQGTMSRKPISMLQIRYILRLLQEGKSKRKIAGILHSGRHTIDGFVYRIEKTGMDPSMLCKLSDAELSTLIYPNKPIKQADSRYEDLKAMLDYFQKELKKTGITKLLLWREYQQTYPDGYGYSQFCEHIMVHSRKTQATMHFEHKPAERVQIDFAGKTLFYTDNLTGEITICPVLVCVLPYSGYTYVEALHSATQEYLFAALCRCMNYFRGVPENVLSDNMKQFVRKSSRYETAFSEVAEQWSLHYHTTLSAARPYKPKDKPTVENIVYVSYMRIYAPMRNETFHNLEQLNHRILECLDAHNQLKVQKRPYSRYERFVQEEQSSLRALPSEPFIVKHTAFAKVQKNYHIILGEDWHFYSVPYQYISRQVKIVYDSEEVEIYLGLQRISVHKRNYRKNAYTTLLEHMPENHKKYLDTKGWNVEYFLSKATEIGDSSLEIMQRILNSRSFTEQAYLACRGLLRLSDNYGKDRFENACKRASSASRVTYQLINNILKNKLDMQVKEQFDLFSRIPDHENIRGPEAYK
jgi:transposase